MLMTSFSLSLVESVTFLIVYGEIDSAEALITVCSRCFLLWKSPSIRVYTPLEDRRPNHGDISSLNPIGARNILVICAESAGRYLAWIWAVKITFLILVSMHFLANSTNNFLCLGVKGGLLLTTIVFSSQFRVVVKTSWSPASLKVRLDDWQHNILLLLRRFWWQRPLQISINGVDMAAKY